MMDFHWHVGGLEGKEVTWVLETIRSFNSKLPQFYYDYCNTFHREGRILHTCNLSKSRQDSDFFVLKNDNDKAC